MNTPKTLPWEHHPDETPQAYNAFQAYLALPRGERSLPRLASDMVGTNPGRDPENPRKPRNVQRELERWSSVHHWQDRVRAWDAEIDRRARTVQMDEALKARQRHARYAQTLMESGMGPAIELIKRITDQSLVLAELSAADLYRLTIAFSRVFPSLANAERAARGEPTVELETPVQPADLQVSDEHLMELWSVLDGLGLSPQPPTQGVQDVADDAPVILPPEATP